MRSKSVNFVASKENADGAPPLVSIITPFYNTERYLEECIESVLVQTYSSWEYILVNNQSTDSSRAIAERYAQKDRRIRLIDTPEFYSQIQNFNRALNHISPVSRYCKVVLADDWIFPECIDRMVALAEANPSAGIITAYRLHGDEVTGDGMPYSNGLIPGREAGRRMILDGYYLTGSPTSVLIRSDIVRASKEFYPENSTHDDTDACFRILAEHDLGFIHQVLTFSRKDDESTLAELFRFGPGPLRKFMFAKIYGPQFLSADEFRAHLRSTTQAYGRFLAESAFQFRGKEFWDFQRRGLTAADATLASIGFSKYLLLEVLDIIFNPKKTVGRLFQLMKSKRKVNKAI